MTAILNIVTNHRKTATPPVIVSWHISRRPVMQACAVVRINLITEMVVISIDEFVHLYKLAVD